ncbi:MAG TPA: ABC transporter permease subunit [Chthoniobacterales bacterium]|nr:ABC transporter permease subunit [Chthoniobacterales bacterium]
MKFASFRLFDRNALTALFTREFRLALINRYFHVFSALALLGGIAAAIFSEDASATGFFHLQIALYFVSLFALLAGVGSAQAEREEWQLLFTQPLPRQSYVIGKFFALGLILAAVLLLLFLPPLFAGADVRTMAKLYLQTLLLAATFLTLGLAAGYFANDRAQALIVAVSAWLLLLFSVDLLALFAARWSGIQQFPDLWVALLMLNPLDAFRIDALFALQQIPAEAANKTPLAGWWTAHAGAWFVVIAVVWSATMMTLASLRMTRWEE